MVLDVQGVWKSYGATDVLKDVSFRIPTGAMVALTGRSGSGKSTLFKLLAGLDHPTRGEIRLEGQPLAQLDDAALSRIRLRRLGLVFQSFNLLPDLTLAQNVRLPLDIAGVGKDEAGRRVAELLDLLGMGAQANQRPHEVSGGQAQRAAIARALANRPAVLLADEPTGSLDQANAENVLAAFEQVNQELGATVLIVTHDPLVIARMPARMAMRDGRVAWEKTRPLEVDALT